MFTDRERQSIGFRFRGGPFRNSPRGDMYSAFSTSPSEPPYAERPPAPNHMSITRKTMSLTQKNSQFIVGEEHVSLRSHWTLDLSINGLQQVENERRPFLGVQAEPFSRLIPTFVFDLWRTRISGSQRRVTGPVTGRLPVTGKAIRTGRLPVTGFQWKPGSAL